MGQIVLKKLGKTCQKICDVNQLCKQIQAVREDFFARIQKDSKLKIVVNPKSVKIESFIKI